MENPSGIIFHVGKKVFLTGIWFNHVVNISCRILKSYWSFVLIPLGSSFTPVANSKYHIEILFFLREKIATYMAYLNYSIHAPQSRTKMPPWYWCKYPAQCYISVWTILFVCWIIFFLNYWANIIITNYCLHTCNSTLLFRLLSCICI